MLFARSGHLCMRVAFSFAGKLALHALDRQARPLQIFFGGLHGTF
jgi:hypothetical protein